MGFSIPIYEYTNTKMKDIKIRKPYTVNIEDIKVFQAIMDSIPKECNIYQQFLWSTYNIAYKITYKLTPC